MPDLTQAESKALEVAVGIAICKLQRIERGADDAARARQIAATAVRLLEEILGSAGYVGPAAGPGTAIAGSPRADAYLLLDLLGQAGLAISPYQGGWLVEAKPGTAGQYMELFPSPLAALRAAHRAGMFEVARPIPIRAGQIWHFQGYGDHEPWILVLLVRTARVDAVVCDPNGLIDDIDIDRRISMTHDNLRRSYVLYREVSA